MTGRYNYDLTRCQQAHELHQDGKTFKEVGAILGVNATRAAIMVDTWTQHQLLLEAQADLAEWRNG